MIDDKTFTITELAERYRKNPSTDRAALKELATKRAYKQHVYEGAGPKGHRYGRKIVEDALGKPPAELPGGVDDVFTRRNTFRGVIRPRSEDSENTEIVGILSSRMTAQDAYLHLAEHAIAMGRGLRIRCLSGRDFFDKQKPLYEAFEKRAKSEGLDPGKILLLFPFGHGALVRSKAEGDSNPHLSQFGLDANNSVGFMRGQAERLKLVPRWVDDLPQSLLVWTEEYALVEIYDYGSVSEQRSGCIGRKAPMLIVRGGSYHRMLGSGFDYIFDRKDDTGIETHGLDDVVRAGQEVTATGQM
jgi:hypothetical protein